MLYLVSLSHIVKFYLEASCSSVLYLKVTLKFEAVTENVNNKYCVHIQTVTQTKRVQLEQITLKPPITNQ